MAARQTNKKKKVVRFRRTPSINVGVVIFALIFCYIIIYVGSYFARDKVAIYEVVKGKSATYSNKSYKGLVLRQETVVGADNPGYINFYVKDGSRVSKVSTVYTLDESGRLSELLESESDEDSAGLSKENKQQIIDEIVRFKNGHSSIHFDEVYNFKYDINSLLLECINLNKLNSISENLQESIGNFQVLKSPYSGIVLFYTDGYENYTINDISESVYNDKGYSKVKVKSGDLVEKGQPVYKVINSEDWSVVVELSQEDAQLYSQNDYVDVRFLKDNLKATAQLEIINSGGKYFGKLSFRRYMVRYADYRFLDIQILGTDIEGLKIPKSSVVEKEYYKIPLGYYSVTPTVDGSGVREGFKKEDFDGTNQTIEFIEIDIAKKDDEYCYVDPAKLENGTILVKDDTMERFQVGTEREVFKGVYNVNSGYTEFMAIDILNESNDYYIVDSQDNYGVQIYDHIVLNASLTDENKIVFQ